MSSYRSIYILLICQVYLTYRAHLFLRSVEGRLFVWRRAITLVSSALVLASATCGFIGQVELHTFPTLCGLLLVAQIDPLDHQTNLSYAV